MGKPILKVTLNIVNAKDKEEISKINKRRSVNKMPYTKTVYLINNDTSDFVIFKETSESLKRIKRKDFSRLRDISMITSIDVQYIVDIINRIYMINNAKDSLSNIDIRYGLVTSIAPLISIGDYNINNIEVIEPDSVIGLALAKSELIDRSLTTR